MTEGSGLGREALLGPYPARDWGFPLRNPHVHRWEARPTQEPNSSLLLFKMAKAFGVSEGNLNMCRLPLPLHLPRCHSGGSRAQANVPKGVRWGRGLSPRSAPLQPALPQLRLPPGTLGSGGLSSFHEALSYAEHCSHSFFLSKCCQHKARMWGGCQRRFGVMQEGGGGQRCRTEKLSRQLSGIALYRECVPGCVPQTRPPVSLRLPPPWLSLPSGSLLFSHHQLLKPELLFSYVDLFIFLLALRSASGK